MKKKLIALAFAFTLFGFSAVPLLAQNTNDPYGLGVVDQQTTFGTRDLKEGIMQIVNVLLGFLGIIAVIIILYGGFVWMTAAGNEENVEKAKKTISAGVIGLIVIFIAYALVIFVIQQILSATGGDPI